MTTTSRKWQNGFLSDSDDDFDKTTNDDKSHKNYYDILGVSKTCSQNEITKAYRKKSRILHPDRHIDEQEKYKLLFQELGEAYSILKDPEKRKVYDNILLHSFGIKGVKNRNFFIPTNEDELDMLFKMAFEDDDNNKNDEHAYLRRPQCPPILITKEITLSDSYFGKKIHVSVSKSVLCISCNTSKKPRCNQCKGTGQTKSNVPGIFRTIEVLCNPCKGTGKTAGKYNEVECGKCKGKGHVSKREWTTHWIQFDCTRCDGSGSFCGSCLNTGYSRETVDLPVTIQKGIKNNGKQVLYKVGHEKKNYENGDVVITYRVINDRY